jgi:hypothetical protein
VQGSASWHPQVDFGSEGTIPKDILVVDDDRGVFGGCYRICSAARAIGLVRQPMASEFAACC